MNRRRTHLRRAAVAAAAMAVLGVAVSAPPTAPAGAQAVQPSYAELTGGAVNVNGTFTPLVGNFVGSDDTDDILWYAPGSAPETLWRGTGNASSPFAKSTAPSVSGSYVPIVGDFSRDTRDDILWYSPGPGPDTLWNFTPTGLVVRQLTINGTFTPIVIPNNGYPDNIFWYAPGAAADWLWVFDFGGGSQTAARYDVNARYTPVVGDFGDDSLGDILWYAPGPGRDVLWKRFSLGAASSFTSTPITINGTYQPLVGDFGPSSPVYADSTSDIAWLSDTTTDQLWANTSGTWTKGTTSIPGPKTVRVPRPGTDRIITWGAAGADRIWQYLPSGYSTRATSLAKVAGDARPIVGRFGATGDGAVLWYRPGSGAERLWLPLES
jgi:hypothetical protein